MTSKFDVILQARLGSSRYKNKIIKEIFRKPLLYHIIRRLQQSKYISRIILATTDEIENRVLQKITDATMIDIFYGNTDDVLDRYYRASNYFKISNIVRISGDCPLIDPKILDLTIEIFKGGSYDYVSNCLHHTFPEGLSVEVFSYQALEKAWKEAVWISEREHVTPYIWKNPNKFVLGEIVNPIGDQSDVRLTIDYASDLVLIRKIYQKLYPVDPYFGLTDVLNLLRRNPSLRKINKDIPKYEGYDKSLQSDSVFRINSRPLT